MSESENKFVFGMHTKGSMERNRGKPELRLVCLSNEIVLEQLMYPSLSACEKFDTDSARWVDKESYETFVKSSKRNFTAKPCVRHTWDLSVYKLQPTHLYA